MLLSAATEAFVEDLFEEAARLVFANMAEDALTSLFKYTSKRLNNADVQKIELLFFNIGMAWALEGIRWRKFPNGTLCSDLDNLVRTRGGIAHGRGANVRLQGLRRWKNMIEIFAEKFEAKVREHVKRATGDAPNW